MSPQRLQITETHAHLPHISLAFGEWCKRAVLANPKDHGQGKKERDVLVLCKNDAGEGDCDFQFVIDNGENENDVSTLIINKMNNTPLGEFITYARSLSTIKRPIEKDCQFLVVCQPGDPQYHINNPGKKKEPTLRLGVTTCAGCLRRPEDDVVACESDGTDEYDGESDEYDSISYREESQSLEMDGPKVSCTELGYGQKTGQVFRTVSFEEDSTLAVPIEYDLSFYATSDAKVFEQVVAYRQGGELETATAVEPQISE